MASLKFGLNIGKKPPTSSTTFTEPRSRKSIFGNAESGEDEESEKEVNQSSGVVVEEITTFKEAATGDVKPQGAKAAKKASVKALKPVKNTHQPSLSSSLTHARRQREAEEVDPSIYDYDAAYDRIHAAREERKAAAEDDATQRKPKYMSKLLAAADVRKKDQLRAKDRLLQREREKEGDEFKDKEQFVTEAYRRQQEELRAAEEVEREREEQEDERRRQGVGMRTFYEQTLAHDEAEHRAAVDAAKAQGSRGQSDTQKTDSSTKEQTDVDIARKLNQQGANIYINEEGQVADKRELLTGGLNVKSRPKSSNSTIDGSAPAQRSTSDGEQHRHPTFGEGRNASKQAMRGRQSRMLEAQLEAATKRAAEQNAEEQQRIERMAKSRKTDGDVQSARERYLARKREAELAKISESRNQ